MLILGSILGPLLFNVFICDMFYFLEDSDIANYADNSTQYNADKNIEFVVTNLEQLSSILFKWPNDNSGAHLGFSEGRGPNFRRGANQYKMKKNISVIIRSYKISFTYNSR